MKNIYMRGCFLTQSGYGIHARQVARWLLDKHPDANYHFELTGWGMTPWILDHNACDGLIGKMLQCAKQPTTKPDISFQVQLPNEWSTEVAKYNVGITAAIETDRCNPNWISDCNKMNAIVVPSEHAKKSLTNVGNINVPLYVIPESFPDAYLTDQIVNLDNFQPTTDFNFLIFGQLTGNNPENDRKNILYTLKWLCEEFKNDKDVGIVLKTNMGRNSKIDKQNVTDMLRDFLTQVRPGVLPKLYLLHGSMNDVEIKSLYKHPKIKALVTLTRGEGFGLPILEAAVNELPIITVPWSGHMDFLSKGKFLKVQHQLRQIHQTRIDNTLFMQGAMWAEPNEIDFKRCVRKFYTQSTEPKKWAIQLAEILRKSHCFESISNIYEERFNNIL